MLGKSRNQFLYTNNCKNAYLKKILSSYRKDKRGRLDTTEQKVEYYFVN